MKTYQCKLPPTRDTFANGSLTELGSGWWWTSSWNGGDGCCGVKFDLNGNHRTFRFAPGKFGGGMYGVASAGQGRIWCTSFSDELYFLDPEQGECIRYGIDDKGAHGMIFHGLALDENTGKILILCRSVRKMCSIAVVVDSRTQKVLKHYEKLPTLNTHPRYCGRTSRGEHVFSHVQPSTDIIVWNPERETLEVRISSDVPTDGYFRPLLTADGRIYMYGKWYRVDDGQMIPGPAAPLEMRYFAESDGMAWGLSDHTSGNGRLYRWQIDSGHLTALCDLPDCSINNFRLVAGKIICVTSYGFFYRIDAMSGTIETSSRFDSDAFGDPDCFIMSAPGRLLGTTFINQRFFEIDLASGAGQDLGRAAGGMVGEVLRVAKINGKVYMATYNRGELVEYDPGRHANYPENPRTVMLPRHHAQRPVGLCCDGQNIFYVCNRTYGLTGSTLIKYTPGSGKSQIIEDPFPGLAFRNILYDRAHRIIISGASIHADGRSAAPTRQEAGVLLIDPENLEVRHFTPLPFWLVTPYGPLADGRILLDAKGDERAAAFLFDLDTLSFEELSTPPEWNLTKNCIHYPGIPGIFVVRQEDGVFLWDVKRMEVIRRLCDTPHKLIVHENLICAVNGQDLTVFEDFYPYYE